MEFPCPAFQVVQALRELRPTEMGDGLCIATTRERFQSDARGRAGLVGLVKAMFTAQRGD